MLKNNILIPGVSISILEIFKLPEEEKPETKKKREYQENQQAEKMQLLYNTILENNYIAAIKAVKPNIETQKGLLYILTRSLRKGVKLQLSCFLKDYKTGDIFPLDHQDICNFDDLKKNISSCQGQRWEIEYY